MKQIKMNFYYPNFNGSYALRLRIWQSNCTVTMPVIIRQKKRLAFRKVVQVMFSSTSAAIHITATHWNAFLGNRTELISIFRYLHGTDECKPNTKYHKKWKNGLNWIVYVNFTFFFYHIQPTFCPIFIETINPTFLYHYILVFGVDNFNNIERYHVNCVFFFRFGVSYS